MSIWKNIKHEKEELKNDITVDILIIGGGLTGLLTAYYLKDKNVCLVEAREIGQGITKNSTAKITYLEGNYNKISKLRGKSTAKHYLYSKQNAIKLYENIIKEENIDCDFIKTTSYLFARKENEIKALKKEYEFLKGEKINIKEEPLPNNIKSLLSYKVDDTYTFNPLKFLKGIYEILKRDGIKTYENTKIIKVKKENGLYECITNKNIKIISKKVIFASSYPYFIFPLMLPLKSYIEKSYIIISKVKDYENYSCINLKNPIYSCRFYKEDENNYQISLSSSHNTSLKLNDTECFLNVKKIFNLKEENIIMKYSNTDIITSDYIPLIGKLKENMYIGCGYNTWGMTGSIIAAKVIKDLIKTGVSEYKELFNPNRITFANLIKLPLSITSNTLSFIRTKIRKNKPWYKKVIIKNNIGIYKDDEGKEHRVKNKCPHLGCSLIFNEEEKTWDCPCHSSRFDIDGNVIKGPSNKNIKI